MILTKKALIDFRNWLLSEYDLRWHEFEDMPEFVRVAYYMEFFNIANIELARETIERIGKQYNEEYESN